MITLNPVERERVTQWIILRGRADAPIRLKREVIEEMLPHLDGREWAPLRDRLVQALEDTKPREGRGRPPVFAKVSITPEEMVGLLNVDEIAKIKSVRKAINFELDRPKRRKPLGRRPKEVNVKEAIKLRKAGVPWNEFQSRIGVSEWTAKRRIRAMEAAARLTGAGK